MAKARLLLEHALWLAGIICLSSLTCLFIVATRAVHQVGLETKTTLQSADKSLAKIGQDVDDLKVMINATLFQVGDASHELADTAREQKKYWNQTGEQTVLAMKQLNQVLAQIQVTTGGLNQDASRITDSTVESMSQVQKTLASTQATLAASTATIESMNKLVADPHIQETLSHIDQTTANIQSTTARVDKEVELLMKPKSIAKTIFGWVLDTASKVAVIFK